MLLTRARMHFVAGSAGPAFCRFINVDKMEILFTIPELSRVFGFQVPERGLVVTGKTEGVFSVRIGRVEISGIIFYQNTPIIGAVGIMTGRAVFLSHRAMSVLVRLEQ